MAIYNKLAIMIQAIFYYIALLGCMVYSFFTIVYVYSDFYIFYLFFLFIPAVIFYIFLDFVNVSLGVWEYRVFLLILLSVFLIPFTFDSIIGIINIENFESIGLEHYYSYFVPPLLNCYIIYYVVRYKWLPPTGRSIPTTPR